jgi:calcium binding protein 39
MSSTPPSPSVAGSASTPAAAANSSSSSSSGAVGGPQHQHHLPSPFEWLSGGLFFGGSRADSQESERSQGEKDLAAIESSSDVKSLISGLGTDLLVVVSSAPAADRSDFFVARSARLRFLLYEERRRTSSQSVLARTSIAWDAVQCLIAPSTPESRMLLLEILHHLARLPFESRKHVTAIFNYFLVAGLDGMDAHLYRPVTVAFRTVILEHFDDFMEILIRRGHSAAVLLPSSIPDNDDSFALPPPSDVGLHAGSMVRACLRHLLLYQALVGTTENVVRYVYPFLDTYVHYPNFDIASDAMETVQMLFTVLNIEHCAEGVQATELPSAAQIAADFLLRDYNGIFDRYNKKLLTPAPASAIQRRPEPLARNVSSAEGGGANYMTRRLALQILSTVLLTRSNYAIMIKYVSSSSNLILVMQLLRDPSPHITLDAFHVFKVFVANPQKPSDISQILRDNKVKLVNYLTTLHQEKEHNDPQFRDEKALIISTINAL